MPITAARGPRAVRRPNVRCRAGIARHYDSTQWPEVERRLVDEPKTLEDLSAKYGISRERVRQIEVRAFDKLQKAMKNMVVEAAARPARAPA